MPPATELAGLVGTLERLIKRERSLSGRRRNLHETIDILYLSAPLDAEQEALLDRLEEQERNVSARRGRLHAQIDELRAQLGLPRWREAREMDSAD